jgi:hypothetical protein
MEESRNHSNGIDKKLTKEQQDQIYLREKDISEVVKNFKRKSRGKGGRVVASHIGSKESNVQTMNIAGKKIKIDLSALSDRARANSAEGLSGVLEDAERGVQDALADVSADNIIDLIQYSEDMFRRSGAYSSLINMFGTMLTLDHWLFGTKGYDGKFDPNINEQYLQAATEIEMYQIKLQFTPLLINALMRGAVYPYKLNNSTKIEFMELPWEICRIDYVEENVRRVKIDLDAIDEEYIRDGEEILDIFPEEISAAWINFQDDAEGMIERGEVVNESWFRISNQAFAISFDSNALKYDGVSIPPFLPALIDVIRHERAKAAMDGRNDLDNAKIIHFKIPTNAEGELLMDTDVVEYFADNIGELLPLGVAGVPTPFDASTISLAGNVGATGLQNIVDKHAKNVFSSFGMSAALFGAESSNNEALRKQTIKAEGFMFMFALPQLKSYLNYELRNTNLGAFRLSFIESSRYSKEEVINMLERTMSYGGSRLKYLAATGMDPITALNALHFEQEILDIDSWMIPKQNANTMSAAQVTGDEGGRPEADEPDTGTDTRENYN